MKKKTEEIWLCIHFFLFKHSGTYKCIDESTNGYGCEMERNKENDFIVYTESAKWISVVPRIYMLCINTHVAAPKFIVGIPSNLT